MRIMHAIWSLSPIAGGPAVALAGFAEAQVHAGLTVAVVANWVEGEPPALADRLRDAGVAVHLVGPCRGRQRHHPLLRPIVESLVAASDVVHLHGVWDHIQHVAARAAHDRHVSYVVTPHGMLARFCLSQKWLKKRFYLAWRLGRNLREAAVIHFTSRTERDSTVSRLRLTRPTIVRPLGIDVAEFDSLPPRGRMRVRYPQLGERRVIVYLGRLHAGKGLELLVPALAQCRVDGAALLVVGPDVDGYGTQIEAMARQHGVADRIIFTGMLEGADRLEALVDADLLALPSFHENFGLVVVEALACGTPVLISDQVNIHQEIVEAGVGAVVQTRVEPLAGALRKWLTDDALRRSAAERARPFALRTYDLQRITDEWVKHYDQIVASHRARAGVA